MRKYLAVLVALVMLITMVIPSVAAAAVDYSYVRVKLSSMGSPSSVTFKVAGAYRIAEDSDVDLFPGITYTIKTDGSGQKISYNNGVSTVSYSLPAKVTFVQYTNGSSSNFLYINNPGYGWRYYSGNMTIRHPSGASYLELVNTVFIETYLYGVIAYEMSNDWPVEALKAQAVCARTYAMSYIKSRQGNSSYTYDLVDTSANQVYKGYPLNSDGTAQQNVITAVDATRAKVITLSGDPTNFADGMYSASNGGQIRTASMRWANGDNTYHVFKNDDYDLENANSPSFTYIFPATTDAANQLTSTTDKNKANAMLALIKTKLPAALLAQKGITATGDVTINSIKSVTPTALRSGVPAGSKEFTQVAVTVNVTANGPVAPSPQIGVKGNNVAIGNGDTTPATADDTDFGNSSVSAGPTYKTYTITNTGTVALNITDIAIGGTNQSDFSVLTPKPTAVLAGGSVTFTVAFDPTVAGVRIATVSIISNDPYSNPYTFQIKGTGTGLSIQKDITSFGFAGITSTVTIGANTIDATVPFGTNLAALQATFTTSGTSIKVNGTDQVSGSTVNDFSGPVVYTVAAEDSSTKDYTVTVAAAPEMQGAEAPQADMSLSSRDTPLASGSDQGGGGMPTSTTCDVTVNLVYISQSSDGDWDTLGELRTQFSSYYPLLGTSNLWLLYPGTSSDGKYLYITVRGYGHGVGMSQRGAQQMATKYGMSYTSIIAFYFNTDIGKSALTTAPITQKGLSQMPGKGSDAAYGQVTASSVNVRATTSTSGTSVGTLSRNTIVEILATSGKWYKVLRGSTGLVGYIQTAYVKKTTVSPTSTPTASVTATASQSASTTPSASGVSPSPSPSPSPTAAGNLPLGKVVVSQLYIRSQPNGAASTIYTLKKDDIVTILDINAGPNWYKVKYAGYIGYSMYQNGTTEYMEVVGSAPTATPTGSAGASATPSATTGAITVKTVTAKANVDNTLTIRKTASTSAAKVGEIPKGATFTVVAVSTTASWLKITYSNLTGYVLAKYAIIGGNSSYHVCTVTSALVNVRSGPSTSSGIVGTLKSGDTVIVSSPVSTSAGKWYTLVLGMGKTYIDSRYARINTAN